MTDNIYDQNANNHQLFLNVPRSFVFGANSIKDSPPRSINAAVLAPRHERAIVAEAECRLQHKCLAIAEEHLQKQEATYCCCCDYWCCDYCCCLITAAASDGVAAAVAAAAAAAAAASAATPPAAAALLLQLLLIQLLPLLR